MPRTANASTQTRQLLAKLSDDPAAWRYGYELCKATGLKSGTLYPTLARLADQGLIETQWREGEPGRPARHAFRLTAGGLAFAAAQAERPMRAARAAFA